MDEKSMCNSASAAYQKYRKTRFFLNLNGLRFICIVMVLWHHAPLADKSHIQFLNRGFMGVDFFFVLSGFLITTLLLREAHEIGRFSIRSFYLRRALRILPVYVFVVSMVATYYIMVQGRVEYLEILPFYYLFLSNFLTDHIPTLSITWSLSVEEQFYLLWPVLLLFLSSTGRIVFLFVLILVNVFISAGLIPTSPKSIGPLLFKLPNSTYAPILMGSLLAISLDRTGSFLFAWRLIGSRYAALVLFIFLIIAFQTTPVDLLGWPNLLIHTIMTATLAALVVRPDTALTPFLEFRPVARIGEISYGIYLYHLIGLDLWHRLTATLWFNDGWVMFLGYSAISVVLAEISFRTLEAWFRRFRPAPPQRALN